MLKKKKGRIFNERKKTLLETAITFRKLTKKRERSKKDLKLDKEITNIFWNRKKEIGVINKESLL